MNSISLDEIDRKILRLLQTEPNVNGATVGDKVGLSQSACWRRMQRLRNEGVIQDSPLILDRKKVGLQTMIFAQVKLTSQGRNNLSEFSDAVQAFPEVLECYVLMGSMDFLLRIVATNTEAYEKFFFNKLSKLPGVQEINSSIALSEIKHTTQLPI